MSVRIWLMWLHRLVGWKGTHWTLLNPFDPFCTQTLSCVHWFGQCRPLLHCSRVEDCQGKCISLPKLDKKKSWDQQSHCVLNIYCGWCEIPTCKGWRVRPEQGHSFQYVSWLWMFSAMQKLRLTWLRKRCIYPCEAGLHWQHFAFSLSGGPRVAVGVQKDGDNKTTHE